MQSQPSTGHKNSRNHTDLFLRLNSEAAESLVSASWQGCRRSPSSRHRSSTGRRGWAHALRSPVSCPCPHSVLHTWQQLQLLYTVWEVDEPICRITTSCGGLCPRSLTPCGDRRGQWGKEGRAGRHRSSCCHWRSSKLEARLPPPNPVQDPGCTAPVACRVGRLPGSSPCSRGGRTRTRGLSWNGRGSQRGRGRHSWTCSWWWSSRCWSTSCWR